MSRARSAWIFSAGVPTARGESLATNYQNTFWCSGPKLECVRSSWMMTHLWVNTLVAKQCPNPGSGGDSPGDDQEHTQMLYWGFTGHTHSILLNSQMLNQPGISVFSTLILSNTHNPVTSGLAIRSFNGLFWQYVVLNKGAVSSPKTFNGNISARCQSGITLDSPCCGINPVCCLPLFCHCLRLVQLSLENIKTSLGWYADSNVPLLNTHGCLSIAWTQTREKLSTLPFFCLRVLVYLFCSSGDVNVWWQRRWFVQRLWAWLWLHMVQDVCAGVCI